jgi:signal transduction histidine kinase
MKERFAADLHDELGANLHTIGLLSDLAEESAVSPEELSILHQRIRNVTERTGIAMRHCANLIEASSLDSGLRANFERASRRILAKLENSISITGEEHLEKLSARTRFDLFLFFNECLVNISRHAEATQFSTELRADSHEIKLSVSDNGRGIFHPKVNGIPKSLKRRARLLGAKLNVDSPENGGTRINLQLRTRKWGRYQ